MSKSTGVFEVDTLGLRELQAGKPTWIIIRELLANAMDEDITQCNIYMSYEYGKAKITVEDDSPTGFRDLTDTFVLFRTTYKRSDVKKRGRYNFGEKQVLCLCNKAHVLSTTGGIYFDITNGTKTTTRKKREKGSEVFVEVKMTKEEFDQCARYCDDIIVPKNIKIHINVNNMEADLIPFKPYKTFTAALKTEEKVDGVLKVVTKTTEVEIHTKEYDYAYIYEMGIPICEIDCEYSINVLQKVPLSVDRDKVDSKYLRDLFALVLNNTTENITEENVSETWVREAITSNKIEGNTVSEIIDKRFGDKALIFNPNDPNANDEAISKGYRLIHGSEMSKEEWLKAKQFTDITSTTSLFGKTAKGVTSLPWESHHYGVANLTKAIAKDFLNLPNLTVTFYKDGAIGSRASYSHNSVSYNLAHINKEFFEADENGYIKQDTLDLIIHELAHEKGNHTEHSYHDCITAMGAWLVKKAIFDKKYFKF